MNKKQIIAMCAALAGDGTSDLGQCALARDIGVDARTVRRWVSGDCKPRGLALRALEKLAKRLGNTTTTDE